MKNTSIKVTGLVVACTVAVGLQLVLGLTPAHAFPIAQPAQQADAGSSHYGPGQNVPKPSDSEMDYYVQKVIAQKEKELGIKPGHGHVRHIAVYGVQNRSDGTSGSPGSSTTPYASRNHASDIYIIENNESILTGKFCGDRAK